MSKYLIQATYTAEGAKGVQAKGGTSRREAVDALTVAAAGGAEPWTTVLLTPEEMDEAAKRSVDYAVPGS